MFNGPGIAKARDECSIELPLTTDPLCNLVEHLQATMEHNFYPSILTMASGECFIIYEYCQWRIQGGSQGATEPPFQTR